MCGDCETETFYENYAQKRALMAAYWRPKRFDVRVATAVEPKPDSADPEQEKRAEV
jgi:hypothetical protein